MLASITRARWEAAMTPDEFLGRVRDLAPAIRERTARAEQLRRLPDETLADFQAAGLFRAMQPKRYGGFELDPATFYQGVMEIAAVCGSTGWIFAVMGAHNWHLALFPPQAQQDVWGEDDSVQLSTSLAPTARSRAWRADFGSAAAGRFRAAAIFANGLCWAASRRHARRARRPICARFCCPAPITRSMTIGMSWASAAPAARTSSSRTLSSRNTAPIPIVTRAR